MDIKAPQQVNADGLEQWVAGDEGRVCAACHCWGPGLRRAALSAHRNGSLRLPYWRKGVLHAASPGKAFKALANRYPLPTP
jgi:hypothetical protein